MTREEAIFYIKELQKTNASMDKKVSEAVDMATEALSADRPTGSWISRIDNDIWMLECSVCGCRVQEEKYRIAVGQNATKCPYCGAELGLGGYSYDEYADRPSQRGDADD